MNLFGIIWLVVYLTIGLLVVKAMNTDGIVDHLSHRSRIIARTAIVFLWLPGFIIAIIYQALKEITK